MAGAVRRPSRPGTANLISMWIEPGFRGRGLGRRLLAHIVAWASERGLRCLALEVTENNPPAVALYERCGFAETSESRPLPSNPALSARRMVRDP